MNLPEIEKKVLNFWKENGIFRLLKEKEERSKRKFVFFEGPPTANGLPHIGHFLTRAYKDVILRFYSLLGFKVLRRAGWDTHGLPVEVEVEKELNIKNKKEIEDYGIEEFIQKCKESVWKYKKEWEIYTERMGFWLDLENPYITYEPFYIETLWKIISLWYKKKILVKEKKVFPYCWRCGTVLSNHELNQPDAYRLVKDPSVYVKVPLKGKKNEYFLFWTTTPWTVPANVGLALNKNFDYGIFEKDKEYFWIELNLGKKLFGKEPEKVVKGSKLLGKAYQAPFSEVFPKFERKTYHGDFVSNEEGTGFVHLAPAYGQEDFELGLKNNLPIIEYINEEGKFDLSNLGENLPFLSSLEGLNFKEADKFIFEEIKKRGFLFEGSLDGASHEYPHCWRCKSALVYRLDSVWVVKTSKFKDRILKNNKKINWIPEFIKEGRMGEWLKEGKDWNFSRKRYWGTPLPIWICQKCGKEKVVDEIKSLSVPTKNRYIFVRHGEAYSNKKNILSCEPETFENRLTPKGVKKIEKLAKSFKDKVDFIVSSPLLRCRQTSEILAKFLKVEVIYDLRLQEINFGELNGKSIDFYHQLIENDPLKQFWRAPKEGENLLQVLKRAYEVILDLEEKYNGKTILIVTHKDVIWSLMSYLLVLPKEKVAYNKKFHLEPGEILKVKTFLPPVDYEKEIDIHRPIVDKIFFKCSCGGKMQRVKEVADVWFDSGAMPYGQSLTLNPKDFPADYISEGIDQTRGWFYTLLAVSTLLGKGNPFKNVIVLGHVLDKEGRKMSKSLGNVVSPMEMMEKYGADALRMYFYSLNPAWESKRFSESDLKKLVNEFFNLLGNIFNFYELYYKKWKKVPKLNVLDEWFLIRFKKLKIDVFESLKNFDVTSASRALIEFLDDFSRWWLRISRERFQQDSAPQFVFEKVFKEYLILLAPFSPFTSEHFWQELRKKIDLPLSIHLESFPKIEKITKKEMKILEEMEKVKDLVSKILSARKALNIRVRQPLKEVFVIGQIKKEFWDIILKETNFLKITFLKEKIPLKPNYFEFENIIIDKEIDEKLYLLGLEREIKRFIQELRKEAGLKPQDKATFAIVGDGLIEKLKMKNLGSSKIIFTKRVPEKFLIQKEIELDEVKFTLYLL